MARGLVTFVRVAAVSFSVLAGIAIKRCRRPADPKEYAVRVQPVPAQDETGATVQAIVGSYDVELYVRIWPTELPPRGCLLMLHGLTWHSAYFAPAAQHFNALGFTVVAYDHPGHGLSGSTHGVRGYHPDEQGYLANIELVAQRALQSCPQGTPLFVYGESLGGALLLKALATRPGLAQMVSGAITAGVPCGRPSNLPPAPVLALIMRMSRLLPLAPMPDDSSTEREGWLAAFGDRQLAIRAYDSDPLVLKGLPLGAAGVLVPLLSGLPEAVKQVSVPVLVMHGKEDSRAPWRQSVEQHQRLASEDKELRLFEGMRHQLLQEAPETQPLVLEAIGAWLLGRTSKGASSPADVSAPV